MSFQHFHVNVYIDSDLDDDDLTDAVEYALADNENIVVRGIDLTTIDD